MKKNKKKEEKTPEQSQIKPVQVDPIAEKYGPIEEYEFSGIQVRHGIINKWLMIIYVVMVLWSIYYLFKNWGGLGPGLGF
jgi:hypothetical protein